MKRSLGATTYALLATFSFGLGGCLYSFDNPNDPKRCHPACGADQKCVNGTCVARAADAGSDAPIPDGRTRDVRGELPAWSDGPRSDLLGPDAPSDSKAHDGYTPPMDSKPGADSRPAADSKPAPFCGDKIRNGTEQCDGSDLGGKDCVKLGLGFSGGTLACASTGCTFDTKGCFKCNDGVKNVGEQCDGNDLGGKSCTALGFGGGALKCSSTCKYVLSQCTTAGFVTAPAGSFYMGAPTTEPCMSPESETRHLVTLTHAFEIQVTETTQADFQTLMGYNYSYAVGCGSSCPVETVSWHEAIAFCNKLSTKYGLPSCYACTGSGPSAACIPEASFSEGKIYACPGYRLPTEAEWEYAYRAGTNTAYYNGPNDLDPQVCCSYCSTKQDANANAVGWGECNSGNTLHAVKQKLANQWGLYDMAGNVWEWCSDWHNKGSLGAENAVDPWGPPSGIDRVIRGGAGGDCTARMRAACRAGWAPPAARQPAIGFRCVRTLLP